MVRLYTRGSRRNSREQVAKPILLKKGDSDGFRTHRNPADWASHLPGKLASQSRPSSGNRVHALDEEPGLADGVVH